MAVTLGPPRTPPWPAAPAPKGKQKARPQSAATPVGAPRGIGQYQNPSKQSAQMAGSHSKAARPNPSGPNAPALRHAL
eukprot:5255247-Prymnesium_polylepis.1